MDAARRGFLRTVLAGTAVAATRRSFAAPPPAPPRDLDVRDVTVPGDHALGRRFTLCVPKHLGPRERVPLVVLLHGLGETGDERAGVYAWLERYGLGTAYERLRRPPIERTSKRADWTDARLDEVNRSLAATPFQGLVLACPYTPNVGHAADLELALDRYARWIVEVVIPRARSEAPVVPDAAHTSIDGCSLGGFVGLEVFLRHPEAFGAWGGVQSAIGLSRAAAYPYRLSLALAKAGPRDLLIETSVGDPFHDANVRLSDGLDGQGIAHDLIVAPGPHDQPWLRETGTIEMLLWHDRRPR